MYPEILDGFCNNPIVKRAIKNNLLQFETIDIKDFAQGCYRKIDDTPYGSSDGMLIRVDVLHKALESVKTENSHVVLLSPKGKVFDQKKARELSLCDHLVLLCGHYEGFDARIEDYADESLSIGSYILSGGENASLVVVDSIIRLIPGVLKENCSNDESFENGLLEYKQYTHPFSYDNKDVPSVLLSGNTKLIQRYKKVSSIMETAKYRPELLYENAKMNKIGQSSSEVLDFDDMILKISSDEKQYEKIKWLTGKLKVPEIYDYYDSGDKTYLLMSKVKGKHLFDDYYLDNPTRLIKTATSALKTLWAVDISSCPFDSTTKAKLDLASFNVDHNLVELPYMSDFQSPMSLLKYLKEHQFNDESRVLSHGDLCLPNIFANQKGIQGFIDLGQAGFGSIYCDIAILLRSIKDNLYGKYKTKERSYVFDEEEFFNNLGIEPDFEKLQWYTLIDQLL